VVGGGPTGVELAGAIAELAQAILSKGFVRLRPGDITVTIMEAGDRLLPQARRSVADYVHAKLEAMGVLVRLRNPVRDITSDYVETAAGRIKTGLTLWAAGVVAPKVSSWLSIEPGPGGKLPVDSHLAVVGVSDVYAVGDVASAMGQDGKPLPALAQVAKQQGTYLGCALRFGKPLRPFVYRHRGDAGVVARNAAFIDFGRVYFKGFTGWLLWAAILVWLLLGFENRMLVVIQWAWQYARRHYSARMVSVDQ
jgi:NADH dehydrogenase